MLCLEQLCSCNNLSRVTRAGGHRIHPFYRLLFLYLFFFFKDLYIFVWNESDKEKSSVGWFTPLGPDWSHEPHFLQVSHMHGRYPMQGLEQSFWFGIQELQTMAEPSIPQCWPQINFPYQHLKVKYAGNIFFALKHLFLLLLLLLLVHLIAKRTEKEPSTNWVPSNSRAAAGPCGSWGLGAQASSLLWVTGTRPWSHYCCFPGDTLVRITNQSKTLYYVTQEPSSLDPIATPSWNICF